MTETEAKQILIVLASAFTAETGESRSAIGKRALNDNTFFTRVIDGGATFTIRTFDRLINWFSENWPDGVVWPENVDRPISSADKLVPTAAIPLRAVTQ